jgi:glutaredoxin-like YruB-family protein|tara:strand:- start:225 stop:467 length:243 start_codon:yes stop_codon:yes gene_type:complete
MSLIKIYTTNWCPYCVMAKRYFDEQEMSYEEINIEEKGMSREELQKVTGGMSVPQIVIDDEVIGGYDNLMAMASAGELPA